MVEYLNLVRDVLENGTQLDLGGKGGGNIAVFGRQKRYDLANGHPLITSRELPEKSWRALVHELLWFLSGSTHVKDLHKYDVHLWDQWATQEAAERFGRELGDLGPIYGKQWRYFGGKGAEPFDQITHVIDLLKNNPDTRRAMVTAWNPEEIGQVFVAPCHALFHFRFMDQRLHLHLFQRSADVPVGVPFNISSYALLLRMVSQVTGLSAGEFVHTTSDTHIYNNQIEQSRELIKRTPLPLPKVSLNPDVHNIFDFRFEDIQLENYQAHQPLKIPVST